MERKDYRYCEAICTGYDDGERKVEVPEAYTALAEEIRRICGEINAAGDALAKLAEERRKAEESVDAAIRALEHTRERLREAKALIG